MLTSTAVRDLHICLFRPNLFKNYFFFNNVPNFQALLKMSSIVDKLFTAQIENCSHQELSEPSRNGNAIPGRLPG